MTFEEKLTAEEKSENTVIKYLRDVDELLDFANGADLTKELLLEYKTKLCENYLPRSVNSKIASINSYLKFTDKEGLKMKSVKFQRDIYRPEEKELTLREYEKLCQTAENLKRERLNLVFQTICASGIRVGELDYITVEAAKKGEATVRLKGKTRTVFLVKDIRKKLLLYAEKQGIKEGKIFVTKNGKPIPRQNIWREMKNLCKKAGVAETKVYPHNLRHLFARTYYKATNDIVGLADILGHSSIETTRIYTISTGKEQKEKMEKLKLSIK